MKIDNGCPQHSINDRCVSCDVSKAKKFQLLGSLKKNCCNCNVCDVCSLYNTSACLDCFTLTLKTMSIKLAGSKSSQREMSERLEYLKTLEKSNEDLY